MDSWVNEQDTVNINASNDLVFYDVIILEYAICGNCKGGALNEHRDVNEWIMWVHKVLCQKLYLKLYPIKSELDTVQNLMDKRIYKLIIWLIELFLAKQILH